MTEKTKLVCFDMDGTIADLYGVDGWLEKLRKEDASPYAEAAPMCDMEKVRLLLNLLKAKGLEIAVITWLSKTSTPHFDKATATAKKEWLDKLNFPYDTFIPLAYGEDKAESVKDKLGKNETALLFDDNAEVRADWKIGTTINPMEYPIEKVLEKLCEKT